MKSFFESIKNEFISILAFLIINFVGFTSKIIKVNREILEQEENNSGSVIFAFWHGRQFLLVFTHKFEGVSIMSSFSRDGELQTKIMSKFGYNLVRGSHKKRGAVESTLELIKRAKGGRDIAFAVDGPHGPGFQAKPGALFIAQKANRVVIPITSSAKHRKIFNNWDKYLFPFPFNKCVVVYGKPVEIKEGDDLNIKLQELEKELNNITEQADKVIQQ